jgi:hypothetical protein
MDLVLVFCKEIPIFLSNISEETVFSPSYVLGAFVKNHVDVAADSYLGVLFCSTSLHFCFCDSTMLFLLLYLPVPLLCYILFQRVPFLVFNTVAPV